MNKRCFKCLCIKPIDAFYVHVQMADGRLNKCKDCTKADVARHRQANLEVVRAHDRLRGGQSLRVAARLAYQQTQAFAQSHSAAAKRWSGRHPERRAAQIAVGNAVRDGRLKPWPVCAVPACNEKPEAHHPDYDQPLAVVWLCPAHHREVHAMTTEAA